jgi:ABC-2 type transport system permease protein
MTSLLRMGAIIGKEIRQLSRDHLTFGMIIGIPLLQILLFGYAINLDVRHLRAGVADQATTQLSRQLIADAEASQVVDIVARARTAGELEDMMRRGEITVGIVIPADFERRVREALRPAAQLLVDGSDPTIASIATRLGAMRFELRKIGVERQSGVFEVRNYL